MEAIILMLWWIVGVSGFIFWWTKDHDATLKDVMLGCVIGIVGPITWIIGYFIHGSESSKTIIKRRRG